MSDERSTDSSGADERGETDDAGSSGGDGLEPSGGPQRVVSDQSVDDILESLDATKSEPADANDGTATGSDSSTSMTTAYGEDESPADVTATDAADGQSVTDTPPTADDTTAQTTTSASAGDESDGEADGRGTVDDTGSDEAASIDAAASSLPDDASVDELAARVEEGTVTGADVRAAEAGEGRESTPEIDDVDLSMDDLETARTGGAGGRADRSDDAGPLAGSVDRDADVGGSDDGGDESPGLLGRLKRFFSR